MGIRRSRRQTQKQKMSLESGSKLHALQTLARNPTAPAGVGSPDWHSSALGYRDISFWCREPLMTGFLCFVSFLLALSAAAQIPPHIPPPGIPVPDSDRQELTAGA